MTVRERYRATMAAVLFILGIVIVVRGITDPRAWPFLLLGFILLLLGAYRLNQVRRYIVSARR